MIRPGPFCQLFVTRLKEAFREPEVIFWVFGFPVLLALGLGIAFQNKPPDRIAVAVANGAGAAEVVAILNRDSRFQAVALSAEESEIRLRLGQAALVITASPGSPPKVDYRYRYDPTRPNSLLARALVDEALQKAAGRKDTVAHVDQEVTEPGARYIDFLIPGLIGMTLLSQGLWGLGIVLVDMRSRKFLKRLVASPMRKSEFLAAMMASRIFFMLIGVFFLLLIAYLVFDVAIRGSLVAATIVGIVGTLCFSSMGTLVSSRAEKIEEVTGLMYSIIFPMIVFSGVFFPSDRFPAFLQPIIKVLPLALFNNAFRAVLIEGADITAQWQPLLSMALWGIACYWLTLRWFRWT
jgi:ABC-type multidrug transport system permease subunit